MTTFKLVSRSTAIKSTLLFLGSARSLGAVLLSIGVLGGAVVKADPPASSQQVTLKDIDLSTAEGQQLAQSRIHEVARTVCTRVSDELDLSHHANYLKCVDSTVAKSTERLQALLARQPAPALARADVK